MAERLADKGDGRNIPPNFKGSNQSGMRASNERMVLTLLRRHAGLAKADIARATGLSAQTVSVIMRSLEQDGLLRRGEPLRGKVGQPSIPMHLNPDGALFYGLKIGRRSSELVLIDFLGNVRDRAQVVYPHPTPKQTTDFARTAYAQIRSRLPETHASRVAGLGVAMPFHIWQWAQTLGLDENWAEAWRRYDMLAELEAVLDVPVYIKNDASAACGAELVFGTGEHTADFLYFYVGYFVGGGVVLGHRLYTGVTGNAAALGSMPVPVPPGDTRQLIEVASLASLEQALKARGLETKAMWLGVQGWPFHAETQARWMRETGRALAYTVASAACVLDVGEVVIDGWLSGEIRAALVAQVAEDLGRINLAGVEAPRIVEGTVGPDARALGAASLALSERYLIDTLL